MRDTIKEALNSYECQYQLDELEDHLPLVDVLSPTHDKTIKYGKMEIELLADHIAEYLSCYD